jgi:uncharacterized membrane protein
VPGPERRRGAAGEPWASAILAATLIVGLGLLLGINPSEVSSPAQTAVEPLEAGLRVFVGYLGVAAELAAGLVIGVAVLRGVAASLVAVLALPGQRAARAELVRLELGRMLVLGLEFTVASDILRTAVAPTRSEILTLGGIVLLRTLLNLFLEREIRAGEAARGDALP